MSVETYQLFHANTSAATITDTFINIYCTTIVVKSLRDIMNCRESRILTLGIIIRREHCAEVGASVA